MRDNHRQISMFPGGEDLPLFSGSPVRVCEPEPITPQAVTTNEVNEVQDTWAACPLCLDTGWAGEHRCDCRRQD